MINFQTAYGKAFGLAITLLLTILTYVGNRIIEGQDKMNETLTTILIQQQDTQRRLTALEAAKSENDIHWKEHDEFTRTFFETYELHRKK